ncbi:hypothetical protein RRG08_045486 [Elysia crispata]|uniref:Uncharacterized protein n=1 Tax=Elysia crispata TaxID=231223 RepID=A0AAE1AEL6_9GAST|nr:hypothetical protein RRG08_045486 [Elysia crispata]
MTGLWTCPVQQPAPVAGQGHGQAGGRDLRQTSGVNVPEYHDSSIIQVDVCREQEDGEGGGETREREGDTLHQASRPTRDLRDGPDMQQGKGGQDC